MKTYEIIEDVFRKTDREWKFGYTYLPPRQSDVIDMLKTAEENLLKVEDNSSFESGGILVTRENGIIDVYVHVGELDLDTDDDLEE